MRNFRDFILTAACVAACLVIWELTLRAVGVRYDYSFYQADPVLYARYRPNAEGWEVKEGENYVKMNSFGMRDRERTLAPAAGTIRIALLGDSLEAALQVPLEKTMAQVLEQKLTADFASTGHKFEVLNFAQGGATLAQEYLMLRDHVWDFHPQIVLLFVGSTSVYTASRRLSGADVPFFVFSDGHLTPDPQNRLPIQNSPADLQRHNRMSDLMNRYRLLLLVRKATQDGIARELDKFNLRGEANPQRPYNPMDTWFPPPAKPEEVQAWQVAEGVLSLTIKDARRHGAEFWLASAGTENEDDPLASEREAFFKERNYSGTYAEDRFGSFATAENIPYIRLEPELLRYAEVNMTSVRGFFNTQPNRGHWNESGNAAVASIVAEHLRTTSNVLRLSGDPSSSASKTSRQNVQ
jgi:hypothetical protein